MREMNKAEGELSLGGSKDGDKIRITKEKMKIINLLVIENAKICQILKFTIITKVQKIWTRMENGSMIKCNRFLKGQTITGMVAGGETMINIQETGLIKGETTTKVGNRDEIH